MKRCQGCGKETNLVSGLGGVMLCRDECFPDAKIYIEEQQSKGESVDVTLWARRRYNRLTDNTRTERTNSRNERLNKKAQALGYKGFSSILTAWDNGEIEIPPNPNS